jgi:para-nitrobenzyl esterase
MQLAHNLNCSTAPDVLACLRAVDANTLLNADSGLTSAFLEWSPAIDGVTVVDDPRNLAAQGNLAPVPVLLGFNHDEGALFNPAPVDVNASDYVAALAKVVGPDLAPLVAAEYPPSDYESPWWAGTAAIRDSQFACPARTLASQLSNPATRANGTVYPVFVYFYTHVFFVVDLIDLFKPLRCFHGSELANVFDFTLLLWGFGEVDLADAFVLYWTQFAKTGNPNGPTVPAWPAWTADGVGNGSDAVAVLDTGVGGVNVTSQTGLLTGACAWWAQHPIPEKYIYG